MASSRAGLAMALHGLPVAGSVLLLERGVELPWIYHRFTVLNPWERGFWVENGDLPWQNASQLAHGLSTRGGWRRTSKGGIWMEKLAPKDSESQPMEMLKTGPIERSNHVSWENWRDFILIIYMAIERTAMLVITRWSNMRLWGLELREVCHEWGKINAPGNRK